MWSIMIMRKAFFSCNTRKIFYMIIASSISLFFLLVMSGFLNNTSSLYKKQYLAEDDTEERTDDLNFDEKLVAQFRSRKGIEMSGEYLYILDEETPATTTTNPAPKRKDIFHQKQYRTFTNEQYLKGFPVWKANKFQRNRVTPTLPPGDFEGNIKQDNPRNDEPEIEKSGARHEQFGGQLAKPLQILVNDPNAGDNDLSQDERSRKEDTENEYIARKIQQKRQARGGHVLFNADEFPRDLGFKRKKKHRQYGLDPVHPDMERGQFQFDKHSRHKNVFQSENNQNQAPVPFKNLFQLRGGYKPYQNMINRQEEVQGKYHRRHRRPTLPSYSQEQENEDRDVQDLFNNNDEDNTMKRFRNRNPSSMTTYAYFRRRVTSPIPNIGFGTVRMDECSGCLKRPYRFIIHGSEVCSNVDSLDLLVLISSAPYHGYERKIIRETWASVTGRNSDPRIRYAFLLGHSSADKQLAIEALIHKDIILQSFTDSYKNLTLKTLMALEWSATHCPGARYIMKTDDDVYANLFNIHRDLIDRDYLSNSIFGWCTMEADPIRDPLSKWFVSRRQYPHHTYPGFCSGTGYVMPRDVARQILHVSVNVPFFFLEDVYISMCAERIGVRLHHVFGFNNMKYDIPYSDCGMYGQHWFYTSHEVTPEEMQDLFRRCG